MKIGLATKGIRLPDDASKSAAESPTPVDYLDDAGVDFPAKVAGLVPFLIRAAGDKDEGNRVCALYALADARDPRATAELRRRLEDPSAKVRLYAACFLTEFGDVTGLPELRRALKRVRNTSPTDNILYYPEAGTLLASFERLTGKSFGKIPAPPGLLSHLKQAEQNKAEYARLLEAWSDWWEWKPETTDAADAPAEKE